MKTTKFKEWIWHCYATQPDAFTAQADAIFQEEQKIAGWSSAPFMGILNCAVGQCMERDEIYLEMGTYMGRSLAGALKNNQASAVVVDNFWEGPQIRNGFYQTLDIFKLRDRVTVYTQSVTDYLELIRPIGVLFYDANHDRGYTYTALHHLEPHLAAEALIIIDDLEIDAALGHRPYPGYKMKSNKPVWDDTIEWLRNNPKSDLFMLTPWGFRQAIIHYRR